MPAALRMRAIAGGLALAALIASAPRPVTGALVITSTDYRQNFDGLAKSGTTGSNFGLATTDTQGWVASRITDGASSANYTIIQHGSTAFSDASLSPALYACVNGDDVAFGARQGTNYAFAIGVLLQNGSASPITRVQISSVLELWRQPSQNPDSGNLGWIDWGIGPRTMSEFNAPPWTGANYHHTGMPTFLPLSTDPLYSTYNLTGTLEGLTWNPGEILVLRWYLPSTFATNRMTASPVLALDDVHLTFTGIGLPEPASTLLGISVMCTALTVRIGHHVSDRPAGAVCRRRRSRRYRR